ncbi:MAG: cell division protein FtsI [Rhodospirillaceae bacterium]|nr:cell division protein FtsI [Rhodospirillaceae bacterium]
MFSPTLTARLKALILPPRPDPARSRRIAEGRLLVSALFVLGVFSAIAVRVLMLASEGNPSLNPYLVDESSVARGEVFDRNGRLLSTNLPIVVLHADPAHIMDPKTAALALAPMLPRYDEADLQHLLTRKTRYVELDRKLTPARHAAILQLGIPGIYFRKSVVRAYPGGDLAAHILGHVDVDNNGIAGVEKSLNTRLSAGENITLSIDSGVQEIVARALQEQIDDYEAVAGAALMMEIGSGEIISMVSLPDYNANHIAAADEEERFNRASLGLYELGSTFKILNTAIALESGTTTLDRRYNVAQPLRVPGKSITDYKTYDWPLSVPEILVLSSNIGSAKMAAEFGGETQRAYLERLGMAQRLSLEIPETSTPQMPRQWKAAEIATVSYGHGIAVSLPHLAAAVSAASGDGVFLEPTLLHRAPADSRIRSRVFSPDTTRAVRSMMRLVVAHPDGTANLAEARGYMVGGKTGTSEKVRPEGGYYKDRNIASFVATFPVHEPKYVLAIMVDDPKGQKKSYYKTTGGWVAAPAAKEIIRHAAPMLGIHPVDEKAPEIRQKLKLDFKIGKGEMSLASY